MEMNENTYVQNVCPKCKAAEYHFIKIYNGSDGFFSFKEFSHYKCGNCNHEFNNSEHAYTIDRTTMQNLLRAEINGEGNLDQFIDNCRKLGIYLSKPYYTREQRINSIIKKMKDMKISKSEIKKVLGAIK